MYISNEWEREQEWNGCWVNVLFGPAIETVKKTTD